MLMLSTIIGGCGKKKRKYQKMLYEEYYEFAFKIAFRYIRSYSEVAHVVNTAFVKMLRTIHEFKYNANNGLEGSLKEWVVTIVVSTAIGWSRWHDPELSTDDVPQESWKPESSTDLLYKELICELKRLPWLHRAVFNMYVIDGYAHGAIAELLSISESESKSILCEARALLQNAVKRDVVAI
jgi:RNA polymerase sigma-70 factor (ECF subfamily)